jgi:RNA polymerase sigma-70 factor (ECF subfamily)
MGWLGTGRRVQQLVEAFYEPLFRYAFRLSGTSADAEDLTQEAFCKAQLRLHQLRDPDRAKAWLFSILRNAYLHRLRAEAQQREVSLDGVNGLAGPEPDPPPDIEPARLQAALDELPEQFRTPVILFYFEAFSYREIAEQMEVPIGTIMSRLARAKAYLRTRLQPRASGGTRSGKPAENGLVPARRGKGEAEGARHGL